MTTDDEGRRAGRDGACAEVVPFPGADPLAGLEDDELLAQWAEVDRGAAALVREALPDLLAADPPHDALSSAAAAIRAGVAAGLWPYRHIEAAAGWRGVPPADDVELWVSAAGAFVAMTDESGMDAEEEASLMALEHADWIGAVLGLVRAGAGSRAEPADLVRHLDATPEVEGAVDPDDVPLVEAAFELVLPVWEAIGALDDARRLTPLGRWGLPRALIRAWGDG